MKNKFALDSAAEAATARAPSALLSLLQFLWLLLLFNSCALSRLLFMLARALISKWRHRSSFSSSVGQLQIYVHAVATAA